MRGWATAALDLLFPAVCLVCGASPGAGRRDPLCGACWRAIARVEAPWCSACGRPLPALEPPEPGAHRLCGDCQQAPPVWDYARAAALYSPPVRDALHAFKFGGRRTLVRPLADLVLEQCGPILPADLEVLVPVPLAPQRERERGFNQAGLLAERVARALDVELEPGWLARVRATPPQTDLGAEARRQNVRGAFVASPGVAGRHVAVFDDILTTGATAGECARVLRTAGARRIGVLTVARVL